MLMRKHFPYEFAAPWVAHPRREAPLTTLCRFQRPRIQKRAATPQGEDDHDKNISDRQQNQRPWLQVHSLHFATPNSLETNTHLEIWNIQIRPGEETGCREGLVGPLFPRGGGAVDPAPSEGRWGPSARGPMFLLDGCSTNPHAPPPMEMLPITGIRSAANASTPERKAGPPHLASILAARLRRKMLVFVSPLYTSLRTQASARLDTWPP